LSARRVWRSIDKQICRKKDARAAVSKDRFIQTGDRGYIDHADPLHLAERVP
jgi:hypothetical protein